MAHDSFQFPRRGSSPLHSRAPSTASDWNGNFDQRPTSGANRPYREADFADSRRGLVRPDTSERYNGTKPPVSHSERSWHPSPARESYSNVVISPPSSPGFHPGFPRPETPSSPYEFSMKAWPGSPLANAAPADSSRPLDSVYNEYFGAALQEVSSVPHKEAVGPIGPPGGPPPDGGTTAWLQVLGGFFLFFNTWGLINAFGVRECQAPSTSAVSH
jgi:hypothetical protein